MDSNAQDLKSKTSLISQCNQLKISCNENSDENSDEDSDEDSD